MFRLAYRRFNDGHDALIGNITVTSGGVGGIRWFEINHATSGTADFTQQGTYQPDTTHRWMGSAAMDASGDLAVGFSASSTAIHPQIRYAGRLSGDPPNTLGQGETTLFSGAGSQTGTNGRWGDYSDITVDPEDDCTFWYTTEYYQTTSAFNWRTRIGNFKFPACSATGGTLEGTVTDASTTDPIAGARVVVSNGLGTTTDAAGHYSIRWHRIPTAPTTRIPATPPRRRTGSPSPRIRRRCATCSSRRPPISRSRRRRTTRTPTSEIRSASAYRSRTSARRLQPASRSPTPCRQEPASTGRSQATAIPAGRSPARLRTRASPARRTVGGSATSTGHVVSSTSGDSIGTYENTASFTSAGAGSGSASATIRVLRTT